MAGSMSEVCKSTDREEDLNFSDSKDFPEEIKDKLRQELKGKTDNIEPSKLSGKLKNMLDSNFGMGWCVIIGGHFSGAFTYVDNLYVEIKCKEVVIVMFKTFLPQK